jgi:hypothetical protein
MANRSSAKNAVRPRPGWRAVSGRTARSRGSEPTRCNEIARSWGASIHNALTSSCGLPHPMRTVWIAKTSPGTPAGDFGAHGLDGGVIPPLVHDEQADHPRPRTNRRAEARSAVIGFSTKIGRPVGQQAFDGRGMTDRRGRHHEAVHRLEGGEIPQPRWQPRQRGRSTARPRCAQPTCTCAPHAMRSRRNEASPATATDEPDPWH